MPWKIIDRLLLPAAFFLIAFVVALTLWQLLIGHRRAEIQGVTSEKARFVKTKMESGAASPHRPAGSGLPEPVRRIWVRSSDIEFDAKLVMSAYPAYQAVEWVDPSYHVRWVTPPTQNQSELGANLGSNELELAALRQAVQTGDTIVSHAVALRQGGRGVLVCVPVKSENQLAGFLVGIFRFNDLIPAILQNVAPGYWVAVYDGNEEIYRPGPQLAPRDAEGAQSTDIQFQQLNWRAQV